MIPIFKNIVFLLFIIQECLIYLVSIHYYQQVTQTKKE